MQLNIGKNLKELRRARDLTQEDLADILGVTYQAVSKWERGEGYPDITMLPTIANYFGVSLDELVGMEHLRSNNLREEYLRQYEEYSSRREMAEIIALLRKALEHFPNDDWFLGALAAHLDNFGETEEEEQRNLEESIAISERLIANSKDTDTVQIVSANICWALLRAGRREEAVRRAKRLPDLFHCMEMRLSDLLEGDERAGECQTTMGILGWAVWYTLRGMLLCDHYNWREKITLLQKSVAFYELIYDQGDFGYANYNLAQNYRCMAELCLDNGEPEQALPFLQRAVRHARGLSRFSEQTRHSSLAVNMRSASPIGASVGKAKYYCQGAYAAKMHGDLLSEERYAPLREHPEFQAVLAALDLGVPALA